jgi:hypothetical protein
MEQVEVEVEVVMIRKLKRLNNSIKAPITPILLHCTTIVLSSTKAV